MTHPAPPFVDYVGIRHIRADDASVIAEVTLEPHLLNRSQVAHGGLIATLLDTTMSRAAQPENGTHGGLATVDMKVTFLNPGRVALRCQAWCRERTGTITFCDGEVRDAAGSLVARGTATYWHAASRSGARPTD